MTAGTGDTGTTTASAADARAYRPVERGGGDARLFGGVCAGLGRATGIDPIVYRVAIVMLTVGGGFGVLVYAAGWLLMPAEGQPMSLIEGWTARRYTVRDVLTLLAAIVAIGFLFSLIGGPGGTTLVTLVVLALGLLTAQKRGVDLPGLLRTLPDRLRGRPASPDEAAAAASAPGMTPPPTPPAPPSPQRPDGLIDLGAYGRGPRTAAYGTAADSDPYVPPAPPAQRRTGRADGWPAALFFFGAAGAGAWAMAAAAPTYGWYATTTWEYGAAAAMLVVGVGLVTGAWWGRTRSLVFWGVVLAIALVALPMVGSGSVKQINTVWRPSTVAQASRPMHIGVGSGRLDLTGVPLKPGKELTTSADMEAGYVRVDVPRDARVHVVGSVVVGTVHIQDPEDHRTGRHLDATMPSTTKKAPVIELHLRGTAGYMEVRRAA